MLTNIYKEKRKLLIRKLQSNDIFISLNTTSTTKKTCLFIYIGFFVFFLKGKVKFIIDLQNCDSLRYLNQI